MLKVRTLERVIRRSPLGMRFVDVVRGVSVTDGLEVTAWLEGTNGPRQRASRSPVSGIYGFRTLPSLRGFEVGDQPASDWCGSHPVEESSNFVVYIEDTLSRFLPQVLVICLPVEGLIEVPLLSSPSRLPPPGLAVVRGELWDRQTDTSGGWARITVGVDGSTYEAISDTRGMFALCMPYAGALPPLIGSPPHGSVPIDQLTWSLNIQVFYQPSAQQRVPNLGADDPPELRSIIGQGRAELYNTEVAHSSTLVRLIRFGEDLVVKTSGRSRLLLDPA